MIPLVAIAGPTACGKTALAIALARRVGGEVISCDSLAVYRGCDTGSAKPTALERQGVPHHLIDVVDPSEPFFASEYAALADAAIADCAARGVPIVVAGGSGLYLRALLRGLLSEGAPDPEFRARLRAESSLLGWPSIHHRLIAVDPIAAARINPNDGVRIERALEVHHQTGRPISALHAEHAKHLRYDAQVWVIDPPMEALDARIALRTRRMIDDGLVEETGHLLERWGRGIKPLEAIGYKEALAVLDGALAREELFERVRVATRRFARRQRNWFAGEPDVLRAPSATALSLDAMAEHLLLHRE